MGIKTHITDISNNLKASIDNDNGLEKNSLVVATRPLKKFDNATKFFVNPTYGFNMNVNAATSGTPEYIHDGGDNTYWEASTIVGIWTFDDTDQAHTGTQSINATSTVNDDIMQCKKSTTIDLSDYGAISGWIYITSWLPGEIRVFGWNTSTSLQIGDDVNIGDYINVGDLNIWQKFNISLVDMDLQNNTIDAIRTKVVATGDAPNFYLDDIQLEALSGGIPPIEFSLKADVGKWLYIYNYSIIFVDTFSPILTDSTMPKLSYDKILNQTLSNGVVYHRIVDGKIEFSFNFKTLAEILSFPGLTIEDLGSDGTNTFMKLSISFIEPIILKSEDADQVCFHVADDLSTLKIFRISAACTEEVRT